MSNTNYKLKFEAEFTANFKKAIAFVSDLNSKLPKLPKFKIDLDNKNNLKLVGSNLKFVNSELNKIGNNKAPLNNLNQLNNKAKEVADNINKIKTPKTSNQNSNKNSNSGGLENIYNLSKGLIASYAVGKVWDYGKEIVQTTARFQSLAMAIKTASDSSVQGEISLQWLKDLSEKRGLGLEQTTEGFKTFQGAMMDSVFSSKDVRKMFGQVSTGITAMGLSAEDGKGVFLALGQMMSKGKVSAEELRGQIGERIPGAFQIAAKSMNLTTQELDKMMQKGELLASDFLPKFARQMEIQFAEGATKSTDTLNASVNRLTNSYDKLLVSVGNTNGTWLQKGMNFTAKSMNGLADYFTASFGEKNELYKQDALPIAEKILDKLTRQFKEEARILKENGNSKDKIGEILNNNVEWKKAELTTSIAKNEAKIIAVEKYIRDLGLKGETKNQIGYIKAVGNMIRNNEANKLSLEGLSSLPNSAMKSLFPEKNSGSEILNKDSENIVDNKVRGAYSETKHIKIDISKFLNIENQTVEKNMDVKAFLDLMEAGLTQIVSNVSTQKY